VILVVAAAGAATYRWGASPRPTVVTPVRDLGAQTTSPQEPAQTVLPAARALDESPDPSGDARLNWLRSAAQGPAKTAAPAPTATAAKTEAAEPSQPEVTAGRPSMAGIPVVVYTTSWCPVCRRAKAWLRSNEIAFEERDIEVSSDYARKIRLLNPRASIPTFDVDGEVMVGFSESQMISMLERAAQKRSMRQ
jgi:glutaredoxin